MIKVKNLNYLQQVIIMARIYGQKCSDYQVVEQKGKDLFLTSVSCGRYNNWYMLREYILQNECINHKIIGMQKKIQEFISQLPESPYILRPFTVFAVDRINPQQHVAIQIICPYVKYGDLNAYIKKQKPKSISEDQIWKILIMLLLGLKTLHDQDQVAETIKLSNIFVQIANQDERFLIGDLLVRKVKKYLSLAQMSSKYISQPEFLFSEHSKQSCDIWQLGAVIYQLMAFKKPFDSFDDAGPCQCQKVSKIAPLPSIYSTELIHLVRFMMQIIPEKRPTCSNLLATNIIKGKAEKHDLNWPDIFDEPFNLDLPTLTQMDESFTASRANEDQTPPTYFNITNNRALLRKSLSETPTNLCNNSLISKHKLNESKETIMVQSLRRCVNFVHHSSKPPKHLTPSRQYRDEVAPRTFVGREISSNQKSLPLINQMPSPQACSLKRNMEKLTRSQEKTKPASNSVELSRRKLSTKIRLPSAENSSRLTLNETKTSRPATQNSQRNQKFDHSFQKNF